jgi:NAD(P)H-dependent FMN reductase
MQNKKKILAISGSTRKSSSNLNLIKVIVSLFQESAEFSIYTDIDQIPHFNPDLDNETPPQAVVDFRNQLSQADGILICTPEYAMGVPGTLKNAIDWTVSSCEFSHKPVALITASSVGEKGHQSLLDTLLIIESNIPESSRLLIQFIKTKISADGVITDQNTLRKIKDLVDSLLKSIN